MDPDRWHCIENLYHAALDRAPEARLALLSAADAGIRQEVESLLNRESAEGMLDRPAIQPIRQENRFRLLAPES